MTFASDDASYIKASSWTDNHVHLPSTEEMVTTTLASERIRATVNCDMGEVSTSASAQVMIYGLRAGDLDDWWLVIGRDMGYTL